MPISRALTGACALAVAVVMLAGVAARAANSSAGPEPVLRIVAPADRARVAPGSRVNVRVEAAPGQVVSTVAVAAGRPIGTTLFRGALPATIPVEIPASAPSGLYHLTALARDASGQLVSSASVTLDVERNLPPQSLRLEPAGLNFRAIGETLPLRASGIFAGSVRAEITRSPDVEYSALDPRVATVNAQGQVTAEGPGSTEVMAAYHGGPSASVEVRVSAPAAMIAPASLRFDPQPVGSSSSGRTVTVTNRSSEPLEITAVRAGGDFVINEDCLHSSPVPAGGTCYITVTFAPSTSGPRAGTVTISTRTTTASTVVHLEGEGKSAP
ncbi:MAG TPA: choice-of-anchor D domain-containing protein [Terriglobia bacterium]|nr:choice-of-anchor D domain-containing protein [Terriglobia bacterium]